MKLLSKGLSGRKVSQNSATQKVMENPLRVLMMDSSVCICMYV